MGGDGTWKLHGVPVSVVRELRDAAHDAVVLVTSAGVAAPRDLASVVGGAQALDAALDKHVAVLACAQVSGGRLVLSPTGPITPYDDVRSIYEASLKGMQRALQAGARRPVIVLQPHDAWPTAELVTLLAALEALYVPLQTRESFPALGSAPDALGVFSAGARGDLLQLVSDAVALEDARGVARDIGGADPERMTPLATARYLTELFRGSAVAVRVLDKREDMEREYPLMAAVDRAAATVERHRGCVVFLEYTPDHYERTVMLVGKGVTYDTGGCDIKAGGVMAGMSRDKCGAAAVAGFVRAAQLLRGGVRVVAALGMVRNSVGEHAYVADELIRSRRGLSVRVGNTDAEGRMVMGDLLAEMADRAESEKNPHLYTVATLTGHVIRAYGTAYSAALDNHAAAAKQHARALQEAGANIADMFEVSTIRREDLAEHAGRAAGDQVHQAGNSASSAMPRGHQAPAAFLLLVAGLHTRDLPYSHLDVAGAAGCLPSPPTAAPLLALAAHYGLVRSLAR